ALRVLGAELARLDEEAALQEERLELVRQRVEAGLPEHDEVADALVDLASARQRRAALLLERASRAADLQGLVGEVELPAGPLDDEVLRPLPPAPSPTTSPADLQVAAAELALRARRAERTPFFDWIQGEVRMRAGDAPAFGLSASIPIPSWRYTDGAVQAAEAEVEVARREARLLSERAGAALERAETVHTSALEAVQASREAVDAARSGIEPLLAPLPPHERLEVRSSVLRLARRHLDVVRDALVARRALERARLAATLPVD
ncbi:MAG: hypothetical protein KC621_12125, partial [Myxococcales bacterium]|nr:hypothetical protein [Myxococcales bacterium]